MKDQRIQDRETALPDLQVSGLLLDKRSQIFMLSKTLLRLHPDWSGHNRRETDGSFKRTFGIYVSNKDDDFHRVVVPVMYFNHPLFSELLRKAKEEYRFSQQGGIMIPCRFLEFERVQTRIAA
ncbi:hypothetical protein DITRI_Ditri20bG0140000 [Diplodiscus trichospermus]